MERSEQRDACFRKVEGDENSQADDRELIPRRPKAC